MNIRLEAYKYGGFLLTFLDRLWVQAIAQYLALYDQPFDGTVLLTDHIDDIVAMFDAESQYEDLAAGWPIEVDADDWIALSCVGWNAADDFATHRMWACTYTLTGTWFSEPWISYISSTNPPTQTCMERWWKRVSDNYVVRDYDCRWFVPEPGVEYRDHILS